MFFNVNMYSGLLLIGFVQGMVYAGMLIARGRRQNRLSDYLLSLTLVVISLHICHYMLGFAGWFNVDDLRTSFMFYFPVHNLFLLGPLIWFYFRSLSNHEFRFGRKDMVHWIPGALYLLLHLLMFGYDKVYNQLILGEELCCHDGIQGAFSATVRYDYGELFDLAFSISIFAYLIATLRAFRRYRRYVQDNFSDTEHIEFNWLRNLLYLLSTGLVVSWVLMFVEYFGEETTFFVDTWGSYLAISIMLYVVSIVGFNATRQLPRLRFREDPVEAVSPPVMEVSDEPSDELLDWKNRLLELMASEKPYLDPTITLTELARRLSTNPSTLSKTINNGFDQNFNDFINSRRVEAFKERAQDPESNRLTLLGIANECGFNSKATFNRAFRKFTGKSPREYLGK